MNVSPDRPHSLRTQLKADTSNPPGQFLDDESSAKIENKLE